MKEIRGQLWDFHRKPLHIICITTNGTVKINGACVMGRGCAFEATQRVPGIALQLGEHVRRSGNVIGWFDGTNILSFPVKHQWHEAADLELIRESATRLAGIASQPTDSPYIFVLPRPGCGNGRLRWEDVREIIAPILPDNVWVINF